MAPAHMMQGSTVTNKVQSGKYLPHSSAAMVKASISAWAVTSCSISVWLWLRATHSPCLSTMTAPMGISPSSSALCASCRAIRIYSSSVFMVSFVFQGAQIRVWGQKFGSILAVLQHVTHHRRTDVGVLRLGKEQNGVDARQRPIGVGNGFFVLEILNGADATQNDGGIHLLGKIDRHGIITAHF